jgi:3-oxoacyl-[acyl-carrier-protein] synthase-3
LFLDLEDHAIGIERVAAYLPPSYIPLKQCHLSGSVISDAQISETWQDIMIEPECLATFFRQQREGACGYVRECVDDFKSRTGINGFHFAADMNSSDMALIAGENILPLPEHRKNVDRIIFYHSTLPEHPVWSTACRLQHMLSLVGAAAISVSQKGGNSWAISLKTALEMLIAETELRKIVLVGSDKFIPPYDRILNGLTVFGDSASAMVVGRSSDFLQVLSLEMADYAESWNPFVLDQKDIEQLQDFIAAQAALMIQNALQAAKVPAGRLALVLPPNVNQKFFEQLSRHCDIPLSRIYTRNLARTGSLCNSDAAVNCLHAQQEGLLPEGSFVAMLGMGLGTSLSCTLLRRGPCQAKERTATDVCPVSLTHMSYYLPPNPITVDSYGESMGFSPEKRARYKDVHGLDVIHISRGQTPFELAVQAARSVLEKSKMPPESIDTVIVHHTFFALSFEPRTLVGQLQHALGLSRAIGFSISGQACASVIAAMITARNTIQAGSAKTVLVVSTDSFLGSQLAREIDDTTLQGEGASAVIIEAGSGRNELRHVCNFVNGSSFRGMAADRKEKERFRLSYFLGCVRIIRETLSRAQLSLDEVKLVVPHNVNRSSWTFILPNLRCGTEKLFTKNIRRRGHVCSSDLIINLSDALEEHELRRGDYVLLTTAGLGAGWGSALIRI